LLDGVSLWSVDINSYRVNHGAPITLNIGAGQTLDFAVGPGGNGHACDSTGFSVNITKLDIEALAGATPELSS